jgi:glycosyltransferase involved in cell wall biosynthesis
VSVDVIIPVFDGERFIRRAVESALMQRLPADPDLTITVRCIDDGSTDGSWRELERIAAGHPTIRISRNPHNLGVAATRNAGVRAGTSEFIAFLDQDDAWEPDKLARQLGVLRSRPDLGYVVGQQRIVLEPGLTRPDWCRPEWLEKPQAGYIPSALLVRRATFLEVGALDETMSAGGDDTDWFARSRRLGVPHFMLDEVVFTRFVHDRNGSRKPQTDDDLLAAVRRHLGRREGEP